MIYLVFIIYYLLVFFFPWEGLKILPSVSSIYLFEVIFVTVVSILLRMPLRFKLKHPKYILKKIIATIALGAVSIGIIKFFKVETPFKYLDNYILQLIVLAPIIEGLIYRHILLGLLQKKNIEVRNQLFFTSLLFSFSHAIAFFSLPMIFYPFILIQLVYTFILGWIVTKSKIDHEAIQAPILLHFIFNLIFLIFLT